MLDGSSTISHSVRTGQIITFALVQGIILAAAVLAYLTFSQPEPEPPTQPVGGGAIVLPLIAAFTLITAIAANMIIVPMMRRTAAARFQGEADSGITIPEPDQPTGPAIARLLGADQAARIVGQACLEGAGIFAAVLMLVDRNPMYLIVTAIALGGIAAQFPSSIKLRHWLETTKDGINA